MSDSSDKGTCQPQKPTQGDFAADGLASLFRPAYECLSFRLSGLSKTCLNIHSDPSANRYIHVV